MKKSYVKPQVYFENFQLSASIAANCTLIINVNGKMCPVTDPELGATYYATVDICGEGNYTPGADDSKICYDTNAVIDNQVFASL